MAQANRNSYKGGISSQTQEILTHQEIDNLNLKSINRVGIPGNKQQLGQSRQDYDNQERGVNNV